MHDSLESGGIPIFQVGRIELSRGQGEGGGHLLTEVPAAPWVQGHSENADLQGWLYCARATLGLFWVLGCLVRNLRQVPGMIPPGGDWREQTGATKLSAFMVG